MVRFATARALAMAVALAIAATRVDDARATTATPRVSSQDATRFGTTPTGRTGSASGTFAATATTSARMVVFGGRELATGRDANDVWEYDMGFDTWTEHLPSSSSAKPMRRAGHACVLEGHRMYVFGGVGGEWRPQPLDDLWVLDLQGSTWRQAVAVTAAPTARYGHSMAPMGMIALWGGTDGARQLSRKPLVRLSLEQLLEPRHEIEVGDPHTEALPIEQPREWW